MRFGRGPGAETKSCSTDYLIGAPRYMLLEGDGSLLFWDNSPHLPHEVYPRRLHITLQNEHPTAVGYLFQIIRCRNTIYFSDGLPNIRRLCRFQGKKQFLAFEEGLSSPLALQGPLVSSYQVILHPAKVPRLNNQI
jgi:hypothetical protein